MSNKLAGKYLSGMPACTFLIRRDEINLNTQHKLLLGIRYDYNSIHGNVFSPRVNYKWSLKDKNESIYFDFKKYNVRISLVSPGFIKTSNLIINYSIL